MDIPDSIPSLAELIKTDISLGRSCYWSIIPRSEEGARTCTKTILRKDVEERDDLIKQLRRLIRSATEPDTLLGSVTPDNLSDIKTKLEKVSKWLLCKGNHRDLHSAAIFQKWSDELVNLEKAGDRPVTDNIRKEHEFEDDNRLSCKGRNLEGARCTNRISNKNRECADAIIEKIAKTRNNSSTARDNILVLAQFLMCQSHQDQAVKRSEEWCAIIQEFFPAAGTAQEQLSTPPSGRSPTADSVATQSTVSNVSSRGDSIAYSTPPTSSPSQRRYTGTRTSPITSPVSNSTRTTKTIDTNQPPQATPIRRVTRRTTYENEQPVVPDFEPFSPKNSKTMLKDLYKLITRKISKKEKPHGYLYGFKRQDGDLIKVGFTDNLKRRMSQWSNRCKQSLTIVLEEPVQHAGKVERLVHAALYQERRREILVNGSCNRGRGCSTRHQEWIEVTEERLRNVVEVWTSWIKTAPYQKGILKPEWREHIDKIRKTQAQDSLEPWRAWLEMTKIEPVDDKSMIAINRREKKEPTAEFKLEPHDKGMVSRNRKEKKDSIVASPKIKMEQVDKVMVAIDRKEKKEPIVTTIEIKLEPDDNGMVAHDGEEKKEPTPEIKLEPDSEVTADIQDLQQGLSELSRKFVESINEIKKEGAEDTPLMAYPTAIQDSSNHPDDPFAASPPPSPA